ncbi:extended synaptotagmin-2-like isoform X2 [Bradysia coprophila]|nr:extended synaptotagmin-2-like isoform X2 [Bradysia coprophila]
METNQRPRSNASVTLPINGKSTTAFVSSLVIKLIAVSVIYGAGYMNWSIAWLITPIVLSETREYLTDPRNVVRRKIARLSASETEKKTILACVKDLPSWVYFPDFERCEWINQILQQMWPFVDEHFSNKLIKDKLEPKIRKALSKMKLNGFEFDRNHILLGRTPIRVGGIKVHDMNTARDEIILDVDLIFASECSINFRLGGIPAALNDFEIYGKIRVILKPLVSKAPFIGGIQVFFLNAPDIDFDLAGPAEISNIPGLRDILRRIIAKKIAKKMVSPNKFAKKLIKDVSASTVKVNEPEGCVRVHVFEARNLIKQDITLLGGKSDPYVVIAIGAHQFRTRTIHDNLNPVWDYWCEALIDSTSERTIKFHLFDWDRSDSDDPLGSATVDLNEVFKTGILDTWLTLKGVEHGELHVRFAWYELSSSSYDLAAALAETKNLGLTSLSSAALCVYVDSAIDLPHIHSDDKPNAFAKVCVSNQERLTSVKKWTDTPIWEQGFTFLVANPELDCVKIRIIGQTSNKKDGETIGQFIHSISDLLLQTDLRIALQEFPLQKSGTTSKVKLSMTLKILKQSGTQSLPPMFAAHRARTPSIQAQSSHDSSSSEEKIVEERVLLKSMRQLSADNSMGLGSIKLTLYYSSKYHILNVTVHKVINVPIKDQSDLPDPYVILHLLPKRVKDNKRKTVVVKNSCDPVYEATFEYGSISPNELKTAELEVTVKTKMTFLSGGSVTIGMVRICLIDKDITEKESTEFYDLMREVKLG